MKYCTWYSLYNTETLLFTSGMGVHLMHGPTIRAGHEQPVELWQNPAQRYEERQARYLTAVGLEKPIYRNMYPIYIPFLRGSPLYTQRVEMPLEDDVIPEDASTLRWDPRCFDRTISPAAIGMALYQESLLAGHFFREPRPGTEGKFLLGASSTEGFLGLHLLEMATSQVRAIPRYFAYDPETKRLGSFEPARHDPKTTVRFVPHAIKPDMTSLDLVGDGGLPPRWQLLTAVDPRSSLYDQASMLLGLTEFMKITAPGSPLVAQGVFGVGPEPLFSIDDRKDAEQLAWAIFRNVEQMHFDVDHRVYVSYAKAETKYPSKVERGVFLNSNDAALLCTALANFLEVIPPEDKSAVWEVSRALDIEASFLSDLQYYDGMFAETYDVTTRSATYPHVWPLATQGLVVRALLEAHRKGCSFELRRTAQRTIEFAMMDRLWSRDKNLFKGEQVLQEGTKYSVYTPLTVAGAVAALREWAIAIRDRAALQLPSSIPTSAPLARETPAPPVIERFKDFVLALPSTGILLSELGPTGEITTGTADTDNDGVRKPPFAGGPFGVAPVFGSAVNVKLP